jgi:hypothetical protein
MKKLLEINDLLNQYISDISLKDRKKDTFTYKINVLSAIGLVLIAREQFDFSEEDWASFSAGISSEIEELSQYIGKSNLDTLFSVIESISKK